MNNRVAICLSGQLRTFYSVTKLYENLGELFPEIEWTLFGACWDADKEEVSKYSHLFRRLEFFEDKPEEGFGTNTKGNFRRLAYLLEKVHQLREAEERILDQKYDAVLWLRLDMVPGPNCFAVVKDKIHKKQIKSSSPFGLHDLLVFNDLGLGAKAKGDKHQWWTNDRIFLGTSKSMSIMSRIYNFYYNSNFPLMNDGHRAFAEHAFINRYAIVRENLSYRIIRPDDWPHPTGPVKTRAWLVEKFFTRDDWKEVYRTNQEKTWRINTNTVEQGEYPK